MQAILHFNAQFVQFLPFCSIESKHQKGFHPSLTPLEDLSKRIGSHDKKKNSVKDCDSEDDEKTLETFFVVERISDEDQPWNVT